MSHDEIRAVVKDTRAGLRRHKEIQLQGGFPIPILETPTKNTLTLLCAAVEQLLAELKERDAGTSEAHDGGPLDAGR